MRRQISILLVEDNVSDAELIEEILRSEEFDPDVKRVASDSDLRACLAHWHPDIIISDYSMPGYSGKAALRTAQQLYPEIPFIFFSGTIGEESAIDSLKDGATDYVLKDRPSRLISAIRRALDGVEERQERRIAERKIRTQAKLLDLAYDAIVVLDDEGRVTFWNHGAERLYGFRESETAGKAPSEFIYDDPALGFLEARTRTLQAGIWSGELRQRTKDKQPLVVLSRWTLIEDEGERRIITISSDITERKSLEAQFLRAQRLESVGTLASGIAHDLNNILAPICMATELLRNSESAADDRAMIEIIEQSARRGAELVKQVLTFVRGSEGKRVPLSLGALVRDISKMAAETFPRNIRTDYYVDRDLRPVTADAGQLHQVLLNLCVNARDAMPEGGTLLLSARNATSEQNSSEIVVEVKDSGSGIRPEVLDKIFDPFFTTKELNKGTGLGLSTVMGIVKSHGGRIAVESAVGRGTCFRISLPAQMEAAVSNESEAKQIPRGNGQLVLVVDDEADLRHVTAQTLLNHGYEVLTASGGSEAVLHFTDPGTVIPVVVTDLMMPGVDGALLAKTIKKLRPNVKIIATTGLSEKRDLPEAIAILQKPFAADDLLRAIYEALHGKPEC